MKPLFRSPWMFLFYLTVAGCILIAWQKGEATIYPPFPKVYTVSLTQEQWGARLKFIADAKEVMRKSSYPGTIISSVNDSLDVIMKEINEQVGMQLQQEAAKGKVDTTRKSVINK